MRGGAVIAEAADRASTPMGVVMTAFGALTAEHWFMAIGLILTGVSIYLRHRHQKRMEAIARERIELERGRRQ